MANADTARFIVGIIGNIISLFLFLSPTPTFINILKAKSVQQYKPDPYLATVLNCALWVFYGMPFVHPDSLLVITINGAGFVIELIYLTIYIIYSDWPKQFYLYMLLGTLVLEVSREAEERKVMMVLMGELLFMVVLVFITLLLVHGTKDRTLLVGMICIVFNIAMYASPLTVMKRVIKSKSVKYMPFYLSLANFLNGGIWFAYSLIKFDPNLMIPNALGLLSGVIQLVLYASFYRTTKWDQNDNDNQNRPEIELPNANATSQA